MENNIQIYEFNSEEFRVMTDEQGEPWFLAKDVCDFLELQTRDLSQALEPDEKSYVDRTHLGLKPGKPMLLVNKHGVYELIFRSNKPNAKRFKKLVKHVLDSIENHGAYITPEKTEEMLNDPDAAEKTLEKIRKERERRKAAEQKLDEYAPKVEQYERLINTEGLFGISELADALKVGPKKLGKYMRGKGILQKRTKSVMPNEPYKSNGMFEIKFTPLPNGKHKSDGKLTGKGFEYFLTKFEGLEL